jgi:hypothetical protein
MVSSRTVEVGSGLLPHGFFFRSVYVHLGVRKLTYCSTFCTIATWCSLPRGVRGFVQYGPAGEGKSPTCDARRLIELDRRVDEIHADVDRENGPDGTAVWRLSNVGHLMSYESLSLRSPSPRMPPPNRLQLARTLDDILAIPPATLQQRSSHTDDSSRSRS